MQVSTRSYLTAGVSFVAAGAIVATPMSPPAPQQEPSHPLVRTSRCSLPRWRRLSPCIAPRIPRRQCMCSPRFRGHSNPPGPRTQYQRSERD